MQNQTFGQAMSRLLKDVERESGATTRHVIVVMLMCTAMGALLLNTVPAGDGLLRDLIRGLGWYFMVAMGAMALFAAKDLTKQPEPDLFDGLD